ncbi:MAG: hypothetical protein QXN04_07720 [Pyrobaculum sp.]
MYEAALACRDFASDYCRLCRQKRSQSYLCVVACLYTALLEEGERAAGVEERVWADLDARRLAALTGFGEEQIGAALRWLAGCKRELRDVALEVLCAGLIEAFARISARCRGFSAPPSSTP